MAPEEVFEESPGPYAPRATFELTFSALAEIIKFHLPRDITARTNVPPHAEVVGVIVDQKTQQVSLLLADPSLAAIQEGWGWGPPSVGTLLATDVEEHRRPDLEEECRSLQERLGELEEKHARCSAVAALDESASLVPDMSGG